jgi:hypothetical protein
MGHPDFRVGKRIFATLAHPDQERAMVKLTPEQQLVAIEHKPSTFSAVPGSWGARGATRVRLQAADKAAIKAALTLAWKNIAPKGSVSDFEGDRPANLEGIFARVRACAATANLLKLEEGTSYGTPSLKVAGKFLLRIKDADTLVLRCDLEAKQLLMEMAPSIYFETDHYKGWPAVLIRLRAIEDDELRHRLTRAWLLVAPKRIAAQLNQPTVSRSGKSVARHRSG